MDFLTDNKKNKLKAFVKFVKDSLEIKTLPRIIIQNGKKTLTTTANYNYNADEKVMRINAKNRALVDIMRSIAHELTHHKQWEDGKLKVQPPDIGGDIEDGANAMAGRLIKMFAKKDSSIYEEEIIEQETTPTTEKEPYPQVAKWEDREGTQPVRGAGNQIKNTSWDEIVGDQLKRGPANPLDLKEEYILKIIQNEMKKMNL